MYCIYIVLFSSHRLFASSIPQQLVYLYCCSHPIAVRDIYPVVVLFSIFNVVSILQQWVLFIFFLAFSEVQCVQFIFVVTFIKHQSIIHMHWSFHSIAVLSFVFVVAFVQLQYLLLIFISVFNHSIVL